MTFLVINATLRVPNDENDTDEDTADKVYNHLGNFIEKNYTNDYTLEVEHD